MSSILSLGTIQSAHGLMSMVAPVTRAASYLTNLAIPNAIPDVETLVSLALTEKIDLPYYYKCMAAQGFSWEWATKLYQLVARKPDVPDLITLYRRGEISQSMLERKASEIGVQANNLSYLIKAAEYFPSPSDLVRFAIREVYNPEIRKKFGMDEDLSPQFLSEAFKAGLPTKQARNFWASHWELPSVTMALEMFHREVINAEELDMLLRAQDVMPFWREKIKQISYNVITRVDARRMYAIGVWSTPEDPTGEQRLLKTYQHMGYSPEDAGSLVEFTKRYENTDMDGLTRAALVSSFEKDIIDIDQLRTHLARLYPNPEVVEFWVQNAVWDKTMSYIDSVIVDIKEAYFSGIIDRDMVQRSLQEADLPTSLITATLKKIDQEAAKKRKVPTISDLTDWFRAGVITEEKYYQKMLLLGYQPEDIQNYMTLIVHGRKTVDRQFLKWGDYVRWFAKGIMNRDNLRETLVAMGFTDEDIAKIILEAEASKEEE